MVKASATLGKQADGTEKRKWYLWSVADGRLVDKDPDEGALVGAGQNIYRAGGVKPVYALRRTAFSDLQDTGTFGAFAPDGRTVVGKCNDDAHRLLCLWKLPESLPTTTVKQPTVQPGRSPSPVATPTAPVAAAGGPLQVLAEANISGVRELNRIFSASWVQTLAFVPGVQPTTLAIGAGGFEFWQGLDGKPERVKRLPLDTDSRLLSFSPDGKTVLTRYGIEQYTPHELRLWRVQDGEPVQTFVGHTDVVMAGALVVRTGKPWLREATTARFASGMWLMAPRSTKSLCLSLQVGMPDAQGSDRSLSARTAPHWRLGQKMGSGSGAHLTTHCSRRYRRNTTSIRSLSHPMGRRSPAGRC